jgi:hypothetical protein
MRLPNLTSHSERTRLALLCLWLTFQYVVFGKFSYINHGSDWSTHVDAVLAMAHVTPSRPYWYPFGASGVDLQAMGFVYDVPRLLFQWLPGWLAYQVWHVAPLWALAAATYAIARTRLGVGHWAALLAAFVAVQPLENHTPYSTAPILSVVLAWGLFRLFDDLRNWRNWAIVGLLAVLLSTASVLPILLIYPALFVGALVLFFYRPLRVIHFVIIAALFVGVYVLRLEAILASIFNAPLSHREAWTHPLLTETYFASAWEALRVALRLKTDGFSTLTGFNAITLSLGLMVIAWTFARSAGTATRKVLLLVTVAVLANFGAAVLLPVFKGELVELVPAAKGFGATRYWWFGSLFVAFGAAGAAMVLRDRFGTRAALAPLILLLIYSLYEKAMIVPYQWLAEGNYVRNSESPVLKSLADRIGKSGTPERILEYGIYSNIFHGYGLETIGGQINLFPERYRRFWVVMIEPSLGKDPAFDFAARDYAGYMTLGLTYEVRDSSAEIALSTKARLNLVALANGRYVVSRTRMTDPELVDLGLGRPESPWDSLTTKEKALINLRENFTGRTNLYVYENKTALPRFRLIEQVAVRPRETQVLDEIATLPVETLRKTVILDAASATAAGIAPESLAGGRVQVVEYTADRIRLDVAAEGGGKAFLVGANSYSPFWKCRVDGVEVPVVLAYAAFWGVALPPGAREVEFSYEPPYRLSRLLREALPLIR